MEKNKLISGSAINVGISIFDKAIAFISIPIFTRLMSTDDYGMYSTYMAWVSIIEHIIGLSMEYSFRTAYYDYGDKYEEYGSAIFSLSTLIAGGLIGIALILCGFFEVAIADIIILCLIHSFILFLGSCLDFKYTIEQNYKKKSASRILPALLGFIISIVLVTLSNKGTFAARVYGTIIGYLIVIMLLVLKIVSRQKVFYNKQYWRYGITVSGPLVFHGLSNVILAGSDRIMLQMLQSNTDAAIYSTAHSMGLIGLALMTAFESIWIPWFSNHLQNNVENSKRTVNKGCKLYLLVGSVSSAGIILVGPDLIALIAPPEYSYAGILLIPIAFGAFLTFMYSISVDLEIYMKNTTNISKNTFVAACLNIILNLIFIKNYGMMGAAFASIISYCLLFIMHYLNARRLDNDLFPFKNYIIPFTEVLLISAFGMLFADNTIVRWVFLAAFFIIKLFWVYKKYIKLN